MMGHIYKCTGSVVLWTLYNRLSRGFTVWMLAQKFDRKIHKKPTGYIKEPFFFDWLRTQMGATKRTSKKRLEEAIQAGFLSECGDNKYLVRSYRKMIEIAMDDQKKKFEENKNNSAIPSPELFLKGDRKFTRDFINWVDPKDNNRTIDLLTGVASVQNSVNFRGKLNQSRLIGCHRNTVQRRNKRNNTKESDRFIMISVFQLLEKPDCSIAEAIDAFQGAEKVYRRGKNYLRGRQFLHKRTINGRSYLAIQIPSVCSSDLDVMETPSIRESASWLHLKAGGRGHRTVSLSLDDSSSDGRKRLPLLVEWPHRFERSKEMGRNVPNHVLNNYLSGLKKILSDNDCRDHILEKTGAFGLKSIETCETFVYLSSNATPLPRNGKDFTSSSL